MFALALLALLAFSAIGAFWYATRGIHQSTETRTHTSAPSVLSTFGAPSRGSYCTGTREMARRYRRIQQGLERPSL